jgi:predicted esterase
LDTELTFLPIRTFPIEDKSNPDNPSYDVAYRLAYGTDFLYLYIEALADSLCYRDRAYQHGDGFALVIATPQSDDAPSDEFYVLAGSAVQDPALEWTRRVFWYYNVTNIFRRVSDATRLAFHDGDSTIGFELLLAWHDVHPNHPWLSDGIGFNLRFVKAVEGGGRNHYEVLSDQIGAENRNRLYTRLQFEQPRVPTDTVQVFVRLNRGHLSADEQLTASVATVASGPVTDELHFSLLSSDPTVIRRLRLPYAIERGLTVSTLPVEMNMVGPGEYSLRWSSQQSTASGERTLTVLPVIAPSEVRERLAAAAVNLSEGSATTIEFRIDEVAEELAQLKPYEAASQQRLTLVEVLDLIRNAELGHDAFAERRGFVRRAYRSNLDNSLQPYVVWIPEDLDASRSYPLFVYLHGSASTERSIRNARHLIPDGFIGLGPRGRGASNAWSWDHAQVDVAEAIGDVTRNLPIDTERIVLAGFSMGGYGVYRTCFESPDTYRALVVLAGSPNIANRWSGTRDYPDFTDPRNLVAFRGMPIFVVHGRNDRNVPFATAAPLVAQLRSAGAHVEFIVEDGRGHELPSEQTVHQLREWMSRQVARNRTDLP